MQLGEVFERFIQQAPISVMFRTLLEHALDPAEIDRIFDDNANRQYTREVLFSSIVELMGAVVCGAQPSVRAAYLSSLGEIAASLSALYEKLKGLEPGVCRAFVQDNAGRLAPLVRQLDAVLPQPVPVYRAKVLDGNHLAGTEHRPKVTRTTRAAVLPGQSLVVLDPATMLVLDVVPCEDAHAQERSLIDQVLPGVEADGSGAITLRRIRLELDRPTEDKERELFLLTDVPKERADAPTLATAYRDR